MTDTLDTYIKSPAPPKDPDAQYVYNEQQFGKLENALRKHHDKILDVQDNATALYENEVTARSTADSAIVQSVETLRATVEGNNTTTQGQIQNIQTAQAESDSSTASKLTALEAKVDSGDAQNLALIRDEAKTRATKVDSLASKVSSLEASFKVGQSENRALVKQETIARADAVSAEATARLALEARVGTAESAITSEATTRAEADTAQATATTNLKSYVGWDGGSYTSNLTQTMNTKVSKTDGASYEWAVQGTIDGATGGLRLTGAKRLNPYTGNVETTANLIIDANTKINGDLIVSGTIKGARIATGDTDGIQNANLVSNAVSNSAFNQGAGSAQTNTLFLRAGARVSIMANYSGGDNLGLTPSLNTLTVASSYGSVPNNSMTIRPSAQATTIGSQAYISNTLVMTSVVTAYASSNTTLMTLFPVPATGTYYFTASANGWGGLTSILVMELSK